MKIVVNEEAFFNLMFSLEEAYKNGSLNNCFDVLLAWECFQEFPVEYLEKGGRGVSSV